jgi:hypothetical protein
MSGVPLQELADDIRQNGLAYHIMRDAEGVILDGRNRLRACEIANVEPRFDVYQGINPVGFIVSANLKRRHLDASQRAMAAAKLATLAHGGDRRSDQAATIAACSGRVDCAAEEQVTQAKAAAMLNVSERSIRHAVVVRDCGNSDLIKKVEQGELSVSAAAKQAKPLPKPPKPKPQPQPAVIDIAPIRKAFKRVEKAVASGNGKQTEERLKELLQAAARALALRGFK